MPLPGSVLFSDVGLKAGRLVWWQSTPAIWLLLDSCAARTGQRVGELHNETFAKLYGAVVIYTWSWLPMRSSGRKEAEAIWHVLWSRFNEVNNGKTGREVLAEAGQTTLVRDRNRL